MNNSWLTRKCAECICSKNIVFGYTHYTYPSHVNFYSQNQNIVTYEQTETTEGIVVWGLDSYKCYECFYEPMDNSNKLFEQNKMLKNLIERYILKIMVKRVQKCDNP